MPFIHNHSHVIYKQEKYLVLSMYKLPFLHPRHTFKEQGKSLSARARLFLHISGFCAVANELQFPRYLLHGLSYKHCVYTLYPQRNRAWYGMSESFPPGCISESFPLLSPLFFLNMKFSHSGLVPLTSVVMSCLFVSWCVCFLYKQ